MTGIASAREGIANRSGRLRNTKGATQGVGTAVGRVSAKLL